jgi:8-oxo-dGTP diphosphatase
LDPKKKLMLETEPVNFCSVCGSRLEPRKAFGRMRPACPSCERIHFQDPKVAAAVLVEKDGRILLARRVNVPQQGKWTLPAGFIEADEDPVRAAERECLEETGIQIRVTDLLDVIHGLEHPRGANILILYRGEIVGGTLIAKDDADEVGFFGPDELPPLAFESTRRALDHWLRNR